MIGSIVMSRRLLAVGAAAMLATAVVPPAMAKPHHRHDDGDADEDGGGHFSDDDRAAVREHFAGKWGNGCPPGLAKKHNGCLPPGQAKKAWAVGHPLPPTVAYEPLAPELVVRLHPPPNGYRYVQVAGDVLMMAEGTRIIVDAITDLSR